MREADRRRRFTATQAKYIDKRNVGGRGRQMTGVVREAEGRAGGEGDMLRRARQAKTAIQITPYPYASACAGDIIAYQGPHQRRAGTVAAPSLPLRAVRKSEKRKKESARGNKAKAIIVAWRNRA